MYDTPIMSAPCVENIATKSQMMPLYGLISDADTIVADALSMIRNINNDLFGDCICENPKGNDSPEKDGFYGFCNKHMKSCKELLDEIGYLKRRLGG